MNLSSLLSIIHSIKDFSNWLVAQGYITPSVLSAQIVQKWGENTSYTQRGGLSRLLTMLRHLGCIHFQQHWEQRQRSKYVRTIPEEVKEKLDLALKDLDKPVYLAFKLHAALGTRSIEIAKLPLDCLRLREGVYRVRIPTGKQDSREQEQDLPDSLVPLVQEQQTFVRQMFGKDFPWLFPNWIGISKGPCVKPRLLRFNYCREQLKAVNSKLNRLLKRLVKKHDIRTCNGELAHVTTHMFRRTWATVADRMGKRPDQIMYGLRHLNFEMQDSYVAVLPEEQEKCIERVLVDKDGNCTVYRTDRDADFLQKEWQTRQVETGVCVRPSIMEACEFEYVCFGCKYSRYTTEHLPRLLEVREDNQHLLERCIKLGEFDSRRVHSARQLIFILNHIVAGLQGKVNHK